MRHRIGGRPGKRGRAPGKRSVGTNRAQLAGMVRSAVGVYCVENSKIVELQKSRERRPLANFCRCKAASLKLIKQIWLMPRLAIGRQRSYMFDITARPGWRALRSRPNETGAVTKIKLGVTGWMCATNAAEGKAESTQA